MWLPTTLFVLFAILSAVGACLIVSHHRSRTAGLLAGAAILLLFLALYLGVIFLISPPDPVL